MPAKSQLHRRETQAANGANVWLSHDPDAGANHETLSGFLDHRIEPDVKATELEVGQGMLDELETAAGGKDGDVVILLLGGRGAQAFHRLLGERAMRGGDELISRLRVFTQDALAPIRMQSGLSFVRDFERLLGDAFFRRVKSFTTVRTDAPDLESEVARFADELGAAGGADIFFLGHGPEPNDASHLAYIKPGSGAMANDVAGLIPISSTILEHHITKFKAGGSAICEEDEAECRRATTIFTLGPAAILGSKRIVQSIVDADTAPAKKRTYRRVMETALPEDPAERTRMLDSNPGLWIRLHPCVRSLVLPNVLS
jgi:6-phosphogluconolactonase/glucosamine-6-phosphate isomerase/deaminase